MSVQFENAPVPTWTIVAQLNAEGEIGLRVIHGPLLGDHKELVEEREGRAVVQLDPDVWPQAIATAVLSLMRWTGADPDPNDCEVYVREDGQDGAESQEWDEAFTHAYIGVCAAIEVQEILSTPEDADPPEARAH